MLQPCRMAQGVLKDTLDAGDVENSRGSSLAAGNARSLLCLVSRGAPRIMLWLKRLRCSLGSN